MHFCVHSPAKRSLNGGYHPTLDKGAGERQGGARVKNTNILNKSSSNIAVRRKRLCDKVEFFKRAIGKMRGK